MNEYRVNVVDVETTGLDPKEHAIVEAGFVPVYVGEEPRFSNAIWTLHNPGRPIPPEASAIHHIIDEDVEHSLPFNDEARQSLSEGADAMAAHNAAFDRSFIGIEDRPWICTMKVAKHLWPNAPGFGNQTLRYWLELPVARDLPVHRTLGDCFVTAELLLREVEELAKRGTEPTLEHLVELTERPVLLRTMPFGKHAGSRFAELPRDYLAWMSRQSFDDPDVNHTVRQALQGNYA